VFKDIQVERELKKRIERDHELLHLYVEVTKDASRNIDLRDTFRDAGFDSDPEHNAFDALGEEALGNITWESIKTPTIRNIIFGFLQFVEKNEFAMDISFGSSGYSLILARAFLDVLSLNFDPFYGNEKEVYHLETFHADYCTVRFQENILTKGTAKLNKLEEALSGEFEGPYPDIPSCRKQLNFVLIGPFTDSGKIATVNLFLERQKNATRYAKHCILMYIRPMKIGPRNVEETFCSFTPPSDLFQKSAKAERLRQCGFEQKIYAKMNSDDEFECTEKHDEHYIFVNAECNNTRCQFEITLFEYQGPLREHRGPNLPPGAEQFGPPEGMSPPVSPTSPGNIALIIPSQMLPELERDKIQQFMDGNMAIQLQARVPGSPIQFILPPGRDGDGVRETTGAHDNDAARNLSTSTAV
jgi:hypothetical protein